MKELFFKVKIFVNKKVNSWLDSIKERVHDYAEIVLTPEGEGPRDIPEEFFFTEEADGTEKMSEEEKILAFNLGLGPSSFSYHYNLHDYKVEVFREKKLVQIKGIERLIYNIPGDGEEMDLNEMFCHKLKVHAPFWAKDYEIRLKAIEYVKEKYPSADC